MLFNIPTATLVRVLPRGRGEMRLYKVSPPVRWGYSYDTNSYKNIAEYVVVSAADVPFSGPETYIFPASESGDILSWSELEGSFRGAWNHDKALLDAGYAV
jgi:hypothetical protein